MSELQFYTHLNVVSDSSILTQEDLIITKEDT